MEKKNKFHYFYNLLIITFISFIIIIIIIIFFYFLIKIKFFSKLTQKNNNYNFRVLVYTCCDQLYSHYIPLFCNTLLQADKLKLIDIEIGTNLNKLSINEEKAINYLRKKYSHSKIKINYICLKIKFPLYTL